MAEPSVNAWSQYPAFARWTPQAQRNVQQLAEVTAEAAIAEAVASPPSDPAKPIGDAEASNQGAPAKSSRCSAKESIARSVRQAGLADHEDKIQVAHLSAVLAALDIPDHHVQTLASASGAVQDDRIHLSSFLTWIFPDGAGEPPPPPPPTAATAEASPDCKGIEMERGSGSLLEQPLVALCNLTAPGLTADSEPPEPGSG
ncbi:unnamed protein product [Symbiodinium natans]|uniref:Uncharacterized protein n=1 Tax=Symbiodinium natans TaxID=878477 RepID=A0A812IJ58_9DINO|nr:unnamed protein product [Symbiodinium natans]